MSNSNILLKLTASGLIEASAQADAGYNIDIKYIGLGTGRYNVELDANGNAITNALTDVIEWVEIDNADMENGEWTLVSALNNVNNGDEFGLAEIALSTADDIANANDHVIAIYSNASQSILTVSPQVDSRIVIAMNASAVDNISVTHKNLGLLDLNSVRDGISILELRFMSRSVSLSDVPDSVAKNSSAVFSFISSDTNFDEPLTFRIESSSELIAFDVSNEIIIDQQITLSTQNVSVDTDVTLFFYATKGSHELLIDSRVITILAKTEFAQDDVILGGVIDADGMGVTWETPGTYQFTVPNWLDGETVSVVVVGSGKAAGSSNEYGGSGGSLRYKNIMLSSGDVLDIVVADESVSTSTANNSEFGALNSSTETGADGGGNGGTGSKSYYYNQGSVSGWVPGYGGGASGYTAGSGGNAGYYPADGAAGTYGGGDGGGKNNGYATGPIIDQSGVQTNFGAGGRISHNPGKQGVVRLVLDQSSYPEYLGITLP